MMSEVDQDNSTQVPLPWDEPMSAQERTVPEEPGVEAPESRELPLLAATTPALLPRPRSTAGGWTIALMCLGLSLIAACILIPSADANRRLAYQREKLTIDLEHLKKQVAVNDEFLARVANDPTLAERLAQRQMKVIREGTRVLNLKSDHMREDSSAFFLVTVPPPPPLPEYQPIGGAFSNLCREPRSQTYMIGAGLFLVAAGLVLGYTPKAS